MLPIVIPFYKNKEQLVKCKAAIESKANTYPLTGIKLFIEDDSNAGWGFTKTVNSGLREVMGLDRDCYNFPGYAILLNQDCYLKPDAIEKMVAFMDSHPKCAIAGIKQLSSENEDHIIHGGTYECFPAGRHEGGRVSQGDCSVNKQVPWVNGACMIVRLEAILEIGLMDETMKMFGSDADWSYTARARGWETWYIADAACVHEQGASKSMDEKMQRVFEKDMLTFRSKWVDGDLYRDLSMEIFTEEVCNAEVVENP